MASEEDHIAVYNEDEDEDDDDEPLKDVVLDDDDDEEEEAGDRFADAGDSDDSDETNSTSSAAFAAVPLSSSSAVSIAALPPSSSAPVNGSGSDPPTVTPALAGGATTGAIVAMPAPGASATPSVEKKPFDDSRKLFQKLWTDEDEIELLRGFLEYNSQRGPNWSGHHHDTTAFYDRIKSRIQLDCNKNQLVEKLRRLKKKYRTVVSRISSGKEFVLKSPHDQTLFEISGKIWGNSIANRPELDDDDQNPNPNPSGGAPIGSAPHTVGDQRVYTGFAIDINSSDNMMMMNMGTPNRSRKRSRVQVEEKGSRNLNSGGGYEAVNAAAPVQAPSEEAVRSCLTPMLKEFIGNLTSGSDSGGGGSKGIGSLASNAIPMNFPEVGLGHGGDGMDAKWRKQMILELEVYSKRLELVQDQIKLSLEELRSRGN